MAVLKKIRERWWGTDTPADRALVEPMELNFDGPPVEYDVRVMTAAHLDEDGRPVPSLLFAGVLPHAADIRPRSPTSTPRAPRGPPSAA